MNVSVIVNREFQYFPHPHAASLELRLARHGIACASRQIVRRFEKALVASPMKRQEAGAAGDLLQQFGTDAAYFQCGEEGQYPLVHPAVIEKRLRIKC
jgi:hypothetical protein